MKQEVEFFVVRKNNKVIRIEPLNDMYTNIQLNIDLSILTEKGLIALQSDEWKSQYINKNTLEIEGEAKDLSFKFDDVIGQIETKEIEIN